MCLRTAGLPLCTFQQLFDIVGVKEIGLRSVLISFTVELFGKGVMFAHFQISGNCSFLKDSLINIKTGRAKISLVCCLDRPLIDLSCFVVISMVTNGI